LALVTAVALIGANARPHVTLMTALPLVWGEGDAADILAGRAARSETLKALEARFDIRPVDTLSASTLGRDVAIIAQPRRLTPKELVAFDKWVRAGGRAMIFADPELIWPSRYPPGDRRRAPPVTLLDPLFAHWGIVLGDSDRDEQRLEIDDRPVVLLAAGRWSAPSICSGSGTHVLDCRIGKGRVVLVGDADLLDARLWQAANVSNPAWLAEQLSLLVDPQRHDSTRLSKMAVGAAIAAATVSLIAFWRRFGRT
jgi:ABC-type uncharacterized transport system